MLKKNNIAPDKDVQINGVFFKSNFIIANLFHLWLSEAHKYTKPIKASQKQRNSKPFMWIPWA